MTKKKSKCTNKKKTKKFEDPYKGITLLNIDDESTKKLIFEIKLQRQKQNLNKEVIPKQENILEPFNEKFEKDSNNLNISNSQLSQSNSTKGTGDKNNESKLNDIKLNDIINDEKEKKK